MTGRLTPAQITNRLILSARWIATDHVPLDGICQVCKVPLCEARAAALTLLAVLGDTSWVPRASRADRTAVDNALRAAGVHYDPPGWAAELRAIADRLHLEQHRP